MKILKTVAVGVAVIAALPAFAATTINFDQLPGGAALPNTGTVITTQYASLGVTFLGTNTVTGATGGLNAWGIIAATGPGGSGNSLNSFGAIPPGGVNNYLLAPRYDVSSFLFAAGASGVSFGLYTGGGQNSVTINAYGSTGNLLQTLTNVQANNGQYDVKTLSAINISRVDIVGQFFSPGGSAKINSFDNLSFTTNVGTVPEPASWALMIAGFGMTGAAMRRRSARMTVTAA